MLNTFEFQIKNHKGCQLCLEIKHPIQRRVQMDFAFLSKDNSKNHTQTEAPISIFWKVIKDEKSQADEGGKPSKIGRHQRSRDY